MRVLFFRFEIFNVKVSIVNALVLSANFKIVYNSKKRAI